MPHTSRLFVCNPFASGETNYHDLFIEVILCICWRKVGAYYLTGIEYKPVTQKPFHTTVCVVYHHLCGYSMYKHVPPAGRCMLIESSTMAALHATPAARAPPTCFTCACKLPKPDGGSMTACIALY